MVYAIRFVPSSSTAISEIKANDKADTNYCDLQGRRISSPSKGIYIHEGKKIVIK